MNGLVIAFPHLAVPGASSTLAVATILGAHLYGQLRRGGIITIRVGSITITVKGRRWPRT